MRPIALLLALCAFTAQAGELYKWTDDQGQVHYTDRPPENTEFEKREVRSEPDSPPQEAVAEAAKETPECERARQNLKTLTESTQVSMDLDGDGTPEALDEAARTAQRERMQTLIGQLCKQK